MSVHSFSPHLMNILNVVEVHFNREPVEPETRELQTFLKAIRGGSITTHMLDNQRRITDRFFSPNALLVYVTPSRSADADLEYHPLLDLSSVEEMLKMHQQNRVAVFDEGKVKASETFKRVNLPTHAHHTPHHRARFKGKTTTVAHDFTISDHHVSLFVKKAIVSHIATLAFNEIKLKASDRKLVREERNQKPEKMSADRSPRAHKTESKPAAVTSKKSKRAEHAAQTEDEVSDELASKRKRKRKQDETEEKKLTDAIDHQETKSRHRKEGIDKSKHRDRA